MKAAEAGGNLEQQEHSFIAGGMQNGTATWDVWHFLTKVNILLTLKSSICALWYLLNGAENVGSHQILHTG